MLKNIFIPNYVYKGIMHNHIAYPKRLKMFGVDTETYNGIPMSLQIYDGKVDYFTWVDKDDILDKFLIYMNKECLARQVNVCYFHNLSFDLGVLLINYHKEFAGKNKIEIVKKVKGVGVVEMSFVISKTWYGEVRLPHKKLLKVLDTGCFFVGYSLDKITHAFDLPVKKMLRPVNIGNVDYRSLSDDNAEKKYFIEYAINDARSQYYAGMTVIKQYEKYNTRICVSLPQFSVRVFRHYFMRNKDVIPLPAPVIMRACILSYHGGKNGWYVNGVTIAKNCYELDVVSMYPFAMYNMPNFIEGRYVFKSSYTPEYQGVWCISGVVKECKYPCLFSHDFKSLSGVIKNVWVTSYELAEALRMKEIKLERCYGYVWIEGDKNGIKTETYNPFKEFVRHFYKEKSNAKTPLDRTTAKLILNSLYGKTIQAVEQDKDKDKFNPDFIYDSEKNQYIDAGGKNFFVAGGMFNPFIATLITGFARAYLHRLEHKYKALHSSTDSIKTLLEPDKSDLIKPSFGDTIDNLGCLKLEVKGRCYMFRNKLYLHFNGDYDISKLKNKTVDFIESELKKYLKKYALHGFLGRCSTLVDLYNKKKTHYTAKHMYMVKESIRQKGVTALKMETVKKQLHGVDFSKIKYI